MSGCPCTSTTVATSDLVTFAAASSSHNCAAIIATTYATSVFCFVYCTIALTMASMTSYSRTSILTCMIAQVIATRPSWFITMPLCYLTQYFILHNSLDYIHLDMQLQNRHYDHLCNLRQNKMESLVYHNV